QDRLHREITTTVAKLVAESGETDPYRVVTFESLHRFDYLTAVLNESLRLNPPAVFTERRAEKDIRLETEDGRWRVDLKRGDVVHVPIYSVHRDPDHFPEPDHFRPERFLPEEATHHRYSFIPFGSG